MTTYVVDMVVGMMVSVRTRDFRVSNRRPKNGVGQDLKHADFGLVHVAAIGSKRLEVRVVRVVRSHLNKRHSKGLSKGIRDLDTLLADATHASATTAVAHRHPRLALDDVHRGYIRRKWNGMGEDMSIERVIVL